MERKRDSDVVYEVNTLPNCDMKYIGETKRTMKKRLTEHRYAMKKGDEQNGIVVHIHKHQHSID